MLLMAPPPGKALIVMVLGIVSTFVFRLIEDKFFK